MISDPTFSSTVPLNEVGPAVQVAENWFVELKRAARGANPAVKHSEEGGLELQWEAPVARARLWQPIDQQNIASLAGVLDVNVTVTLSAGTGKVVEWIAILDECDGEAKFHAKFKLSVTRLKQGLIVTGFATGVRLDPARRYRFCIQFSESPNQLILRSVEGEAIPASAPAPAMNRRNSDDSALLVEQLKCTLDFDAQSVDSAAVERGVRTLSERNDRESLLRLMEYVGGITQPVDRLHPLRSQVIHYYARTMLRMNVSETAYVHLKALLTNPLLAGALSDSEIRQMRKLLAHACVRTGRVDEAAQIQRALLREDPLDWEPYFQLGILQSSDAIQARRLYHDAAETLAGRMPGTSLTAIAESYIDEGAPGEALKRALGRLQEVSGDGEMPRNDDCELYLTLANAWLAAGETEMWRASLERYFGLFDLPGPDIESEERRRHILHMRQRPMVTDRSGPLVTVIMTSFDAAETIEYAARSVLNQEHGNLRLVIVDDCSKDDSREVIERIASEDDRVVTMFNDTNMGTYCSKNRALRQFESDFFTFHDSDDWMHPDRLSAHLTAMCDEVRFTTSMWIRVDENGRAVARHAGGYLYENPASAFFGADLLESVGFFDSVRSGADSEFTWRARHILGDNAVLKIPKPLALGLNRLGSLTRSGPAAFNEHRYSPARVKYWESWAAWHNRVALHSVPSELFIPYPLDRRRFEAPAEILPESEHSSAA
jgi:hypothetical protein